MTSDGGDAGSTPVESTSGTSGGTSSTESSSAESPYGIGAVPDDDAAATGPTPLDTELEDQQVSGDA